MAKIARSKVRDIHGRWRPGVVLSLIELGLWDLKRFKVEVEHTRRTDPDIDEALITFLDERVRELVADYFA
jgi:hypothetical protein